MRRENTEELQRKATLGCLRSQLELANHYARCGSQAENKELAVYWAEKAISLASNPEKLYIAKLFVWLKAYDKAVNVFKHLMSDDYPPAFFHYGLLLKRGVITLKEEESFDKAFFNGALKGHVYCVRSYLLNLAKRKRGVLLFPLIGVGLILTLLYGLFLVFAFPKSDLIYK